jgi:hypothetical protein
MAARFDRRAGVQAAAIAVVVVLAVAWAVYKHGEPMGRDELRIQAQELVSQAAEAGALLELAGHHHVTERFRQEHLQQLRDHAMETETRLRESTFQAQFDTQGQQLREVAHGLASALRSPALAPGALEPIRAQAHAVDEALPKDPP